MQTVKNIFEFLGSRGNLEKLIESWGEVRKKHEDACPNHIEKMEKKE